MQSLKTLLSLPSLWIKVLFGLETKNNTKLCGVPTSSIYALHNIENTSL